MDFGENLLFHSQQPHISVWNDESHLKWMEKILWFIAFCLMLHCFRWLHYSHIIFSKLLFLEMENCVKRMEKNGARFEMSYPFNVFWDIWMNIILFWQTDNHIQNYLKCIEYAFCFKLCVSSIVLFVFSFTLEFARTITVINKQLYEPAISTLTYGIVYFIISIWY